MNLDTFIDLILLSNWYQNEIPCNTLNILGKLREISKISPYFSVSAIRQVSPKLWPNCFGRNFGFGRTLVKINNGLVNALFRF